MIGDGNTYKFVPADLTIKEGDGIKFTVVSIPPHNVAFDPAQRFPRMPQPQLDANMGPGKIGELSSAAAAEHRRCRHDLVRRHQARQVRLPLHTAPRDGHEGNGHGCSKLTGDGST